MCKGCSRIYRWLSCICRPWLRYACYQQCTEVRTSQSTCSLNFLSLAGLDSVGTPQSNVRSTRTPVSTASRAGSTAMLRRSMDLSLPTGSARSVARLREDAADMASPSQVSYHMHIYGLRKPVNASHALISYQFRNSSCQSQKSDP